LLISINLYQYYLKIQQSIGQIESDILKTSVFTIFSKIQDTNIELFFQKLSETYLKPLKLINFYIKLKLKLRLVYFK
jgi:hypothetical protein